MDVNFMLVLFALVLQKANGADYADELQDFYKINGPNMQLIHHGSKSYYIGTHIKVNFMAAEQFCRYHNMNLVTIDSEEENSFLEKNLVEAGRDEESFWTSGNRFADSVKWMWLSTGKLVKYTNWRQGEPNNLVKEEQCIVLHLRNKQLHWNDLSWWIGCYFICEKAWTKEDYKLLISKSETHCNNEVVQSTIGNSQLWKLLQVRSLN